MAHFRKYRRAGVRHPLHDYRSRCIYHVVLMKENGIADFSSIEGIPGNHDWPPIAVPTATGQIIAQAMKELKKFYPFIWIQRRCIMPDHLHMCIFVRSATKVHLGHIIAKLKRLCGELWEAAGGLPDTHFFREGFHDVILRGKDQRQRMLDYISDNPRRHLVRRTHPGWHRRFPITHHSGVTYEAYGNWDLLAESQLVAVMISKHYSEQLLKAKKRFWLKTVNNNGVLVSPFISQPEKKIRDWALANDAALIIITDEEFGERFHPSGVHHEVCSEGRLLLVSAPRPAGRSQREHCLFMNALASDIAKGKFHIKI